LTVITVLVKIGGYLGYRLSQPSVLGELIMGVLPGPSVINFLNMPFFSDTHLAQTISHLGELGVMFLMFLAA